MRKLLPLALFLITGCPDPTNAPATDPDAAASAGGADGEGGSEGGDDGSGPQHSVDAKVVPGEGVVLSGTISYPGEGTGKIRLDVLKVEGSSPPMLAKTLELPSFGDWAIEVPKDFGVVRVVGFLDQTGDGPTADDPAMAVPGGVEVGTEPIENIELILADDPDLGDLTPGGPPPEGGAEMPMDEPIVGGPGDPGGPGGGEAEGQTTEGDAPAEGEVPAEGDAPVEGPPPAEGDAGEVDLEAPAEEAGAQP